MSLRVWRLMTFVFQSSPTAESGRDGHKSPQFPLLDWRSQDFLVTEPDSSPNLCLSPFGNLRTPCLSPIARGSRPYSTSGSRMSNRGCRPAM